MPRLRFRWPENHAGWMVALTLVTWGGASFLGADTYQLLPLARSMDGVTLYNLFDLVTYRAAGDQAPVLLRGWRGWSCRPGD